MYEHIKICILLFLYFQNVLSYKIYQLDSAEGTKLLPKIRQILLNQRHGETEYQNLHVRHAKREQQARLKPVGESVFVKRIIPHGYTTGEYEYDSKLNTVFKPLARYHVKKPIEEHDRSVLEDFESELKLKERSDKDLIVLVQKEQRQLDLLSQIQKVLNHNTRQQSLKKKAKARFRELLNKLGKNALLMLREKSVEDHGPFAPGKLPIELQQSGSSEEQDVKVVYPTYPFWNYWTYHKTLYQDRCPGNLIKVGNMCVSSIGHRRFAHPSETRRSSKKHKSRHSIRSARKKHLYGNK